MAVSLMALLGLLFHSLTMAQDRALIIEAESCLVELTPLGQAYWQGNLIYQQR